MTYQMQPHESHVEKFAFDFTHEACMLDMHLAGQVDRIACGRGEWALGQSRLFSPSLTPMQVLASAGMDCPRHPAAHPALPRDTVLHDPDLPVRGG